MKNIIPILVIFLFNLLCTHNNVYADIYEIDKEVHLKVLKTTIGQTIFTTLLEEDISKLNQDEVIKRFDKKLAQLEDLILRLKIKEFFIKISEGADMDGQLTDDMDNILTHIHIYQSIEVAQNFKKDQERKIVKNLLMGIDKDLVHIEGNEQLIELLSLGDCDDEVLVTTRPIFIMPENGIYTNDLGLTSEIVREVLNDKAGIKIASFVIGRSIDPSNTQNINSFIREFNRLHNENLAWEVRNIFINIYQGKNYDENDQRIDELVCSLRMFKIWKIIYHMDEKGHNTARGLLMHHKMNLIDLDIFFKLIQTLKLETEKRIRTVLVAVMSFL